MFINDNVCFIFIMCALYMYVYIYFYIYIYAFIDIYEIYAYTHICRAGTHCITLNTGLKANGKAT